MTSGTRLYINLTNHCNLNCPFCCMYSGTDKQTFLPFEEFKYIIDNTDGEFELQLEGGEPLLHPQFFTYIEYALATKRCKKVIILTNGVLLREKNYMKRFIYIANWNGVPFEIKVSVNYFVTPQVKGMIAYLSNLKFALENMRYISLRLNVRLTKDHNKQDRELINNLTKYDLKSISDIYYFQSYGRLTGDSQYNGPVIVQNIENWSIYASDGRCFGQDLVARSEYEKSLP